MIIRRGDEHPGQWRIWFAWHPVRTVDGDLVWWQYVYRRKFYFEWEYVL